MVHPFILSPHTSPHLHISLFLRTQRTKRTKRKRKEKKRGKKMAPQDNVNMLCLFPSSLLHSISWLECLRASVLSTVAYLYTCTAYLIHQQAYIFCHSIRFVIGFMVGNYHIGKWRWNQARRGYGFVYFRVRHSLGAAHWVAQWARWKTIMILVHLYT